MIRLWSKMVRRGRKVYLPPVPPVDVPMECPKCGAEPTMADRDWVWCLICKWNKSRSEMTTKIDPAREATTAVIAELEADPVWTQTKMSHWRCAKNPNFAVEVGYVYGECTIRTNRLRRGVDVGTLETVRGSNREAMVDELKSIMRVIAEGDKA